MRLGKRSLLTIFFELVISFMFSAAVVFAEEEAAFTGIIQLRGSDTIIRTDSGDYILIGEDLSHCVGKKMTITGAVIQERNGHQVVRIDLYEEVNEESSDENERGTKVFSPTLSIMTVSNFRDDASLLTVRRGFC